MTINVVTLVPWLRGEIYGYGKRVSGQRKRKKRWQSLAKTSANGQGAISNGANDPRVWDYLPDAEPEMADNINPGMNELIYI